MTKPSLERVVAQIIDPTAFAMKPTAYGLATEEEMLAKTMVGPMRAVAFDKARQILQAIHRHGQ